MAAIGYERWRPRARRGAGPTRSGAGRRSRRAAARADPVVGHVAALDRRLGRVVARVAAHHRARRASRISSVDRAARRRLQASSRRSRRPADSARPARPGGSGVSVFLFQRKRHAVLRREQDARPPQRRPASSCRSGVMSSRIQNAAAVRADHEVVVLDHEVADRRRRHVQPQRLPVLAVVERDVDRLLACRRRAARAASDLRARR